MKTPRSMSDGYAPCIPYPLAWSPPASLPAKWRVQERRRDGASYVVTTERGWMTVIASACQESDGKRWVHLSCAYPSRLPTWTELTMIRDVLLGAHAKTIQVLAPKSEHVNIHPYCLHLWHCLDGDPLPDFTQGTGQI